MLNKVFTLVNQSNRADVFPIHNIWRQRLWILILEEPSTIMSNIFLENFARYVELPSDQNQIFQQQLAGIPHWSVINPFIEAWNSTRHNFAAESFRWIWLLHQSQKDSSMIQKSSFSDMSILVNKISSGENTLTQTRQIATTLVTTVAHFIKQSNVVGSLNVDSVNPLDIGPISVQQIKELSNLITKTTIVNYRKNRQTKILQISRSTLQ